ncbi:putative tannase and feruloyl esterase [Lyophyllum shimeji]|uniref:Carboxylic ester hydrolase n=1 Tax=Lyophyllum shimeji TaxID=47721 RepID=A0A9P3UUL8_LYOSH|nr:putative tannase and feruloyl esterase [Lyophyllum shimeji]
MYRNNNYDNQPSGSGESRNMQDSASGASPGGEGGAGRVYDAPAPPTMMGYPPQQFFAQGSFPTVGPPNQQQGQMPIPMMGGYFIQQPMGYPSMSSVNPYVGPGPYALHQGPVVYPNMAQAESSGDSAQHQTADRQRREPDGMDVDEAQPEPRNARPRAPTPPERVPRGESTPRPGPSTRPGARTSPQRAPRADTAPRAGPSRIDRRPSSTARRTTRHERPDLQEDLIRRLEAAGIHREFCDFLDAGTAQLVLTQLLDHNESMRAELNRMKARELVMIEQLSMAKKRPAPVSPDRGEGPSSRPMKIHQSDSRRDDRADRTESRYPDYRREPEPRRDDRRYEPEQRPREYRRIDDDTRRDDRRRDRRTDEEPRRNERRMDRESSRERDIRPVRPLPVRSVDPSGSSSATSSHSEPLDQAAARRARRVRNPDRSGNRAEVVTYQFPPAAPAPPATMPQPPSPTLPSFDDDSDMGESSDDSSKKKKKKNSAGQAQHRANQARHEENMRPGRIPDEIGVVLINGHHERDNRFWDMLDMSFYCSPSPTACTPRRPQHWPPHRRSPRGHHILVTGNQSKNKNAQVSDEDRYHGYLLLREFLRVSNSVNDRIRDRTMRLAASSEELSRLPRPDVPPANPDVPARVTRPPGAFEYRAGSRTRGAGLSQPGPGHAFDIEHWARHVLHHGRPGSTNPYGGIPMDYAFRVHRRGVMGYLLANLLAPTAYASRQEYVRIFASVVARPGRYAEAVADYNYRNPQQPFTPLQAPEFTIQRIVIADPRAGVTEQEVLRNMLDNRIPVEWADHAYTFGLYYWAFNYANSGASASFFRSIDDDRVVRLDRTGVPPAIPQWDGWRHPTTEDITRVQTLMYLELEERNMDCLESRDWLRVGQDVHFRELPSRRGQYPAHILTPPTHGLTSQNVTATPSGASTSTAATSTTVAVTASAVTQTPVDPVNALMGPLAQAAISASPGPALGDVDQEMASATDTAEATNHSASDAITKYVDTYKSLNEAVDTENLISFFDPHNAAHSIAWSNTTVGSNNGHDGGVANGTAFLNHPEVINDFAYRAIHVQTVIGKQIVQAYYGQPHHKSYYLGCSSGGRQGTQAALKYPEDFDGIVAGAPATFCNDFLGWGGMMGRYDGAPNTSLIPPALWNLVAAEVLKQCDELDGVKDGIITEPDACAFRPEAIQCMGKNTTDCLSKPQVDALRKIYSPLYGSDGKLLYPRYEPGMEAGGNWRVYFNGSINPLISGWYRFAVLNDTNYDFSEFGLREIELADRIDPGGISTSSGDLSAFQKRGGKFITYHGRRDQVSTSELFMIPALNMYRV